jgi:hypothetical protein
MATSISPLSYLDASSYQSLTPSASATSSSAGSAVSATVEIKALAQQGNFQAFINNSMAAALLQPSDGASSGQSPNTLINNLLQQVLAAYQTSTTPGSTTSAAG